VSGLGNYDDVCIRAMQGGASSIGIEILDTLHVHMRNVEVEGTHLATLVKIHGDISTMIFEQLTLAWPTVTGAIGMDIVSGRNILVRGGHIADFTTVNGTAIQVGAKDVRFENVWLDEQPSMSFTYPYQAGQIRVRGCRGTPVLDDVLQPPSTPAPFERGRGFSRDAIIEYGITNPRHEVYGLPLWNAVSGPIVALRSSEPGHILTLAIDAGVTVVQATPSNDGNIRLAQSGDLTPASKTMLRLFYDGALWHELSRAVH
jgi:hypothetical protein